MKDRVLTVKQSKFVDYFIQYGGNATKAAIMAGYSSNTARTIGSENLTKPHIVNAIKEQTMRLENERIADMKEVKEVWTTIMRSEVEFTNDRLRASEYLAKTSGAFIHVTDENLTNARTRKANAEVELAEYKVKEESKTVAPMQVIFVDDLKELPDEADPLIEKGQRNNET